MLFTNDSCVVLQYDIIIIQNILVVPTYEFIGRTRVIWCKCVKYRHFIRLYTTK